MDSENKNDLVERFSHLTARLERLKSERAFFMKEERLYLSIFRQQASEFGLTPRGRSGLSVGTMDKDEGSNLLT